jgi:hypothetical protein
MKPRRVASTESPLTMLYCGVLAKFKEWLEDVAAREQTPIVQWERSKFSVGVVEHFTEHFTAPPHFTAWPMQGEKPIKPLFAPSREVPLPLVTT